MANTTKVTKAMALNAIISVLATLDPETEVNAVSNENMNGYSKVVSLADMTAYCENELALLAKKKSSTSKAAKANAETRMALAEIILATLANAGKPMTVSEMQTANDELRVSADGSPISNQRITSVCYALVETSQLVNTKEKKKSYFSIA